MIEQRELARTKRVVVRAWEYVRKDIEATTHEACGKETPFLDHLQRAFDEAFAAVMEAVEASRIDAFADLVSTQYGPELGRAELYGVDRPVRAGFLALAANPLWWGHILVALMSLGVCELDTVVFRVQGKIQYKDVSESDRVSVQVRHDLVKRVLATFYPLLRYTDLGSEAGNKREGAEEAHRYFAMNQDRALHLFYLLGVESRERVREYFTQHYEAAQQHDFGHNPRHRLTIGWIQRGDYGAQITEAELEALSAQARRAVGYAGSIPSVLIQDPYIDLDVSSTYYRDTHDATIVPGIIDACAKAHGLYGYS
jgi:hypothetical protein